MFWICCRQYAVIFFCFVFKYFPVIFEHLTSTKARTSTLPLTHDVESNVILTPGGRFLFQRLKLQLETEHSLVYTLDYAHQFWRGLIVIDLAEKLISLFMFFFNAAGGYLYMEDINWCNYQYIDWYFNKPVWHFPLKHSVINTELIKEYRETRKPKDVISIS